MGHGYVSLLKGNLSLDTIDVMSYRPWTSMRWRYFFCLFAHVESLNKHEMGTSKMLGNHGKASSNCFPSQTWIHVYATGGCE